MPPDAAGQECAGQRASRPVPTLGGVERASSQDGSPVSDGSLPGVAGARHEPLGHGHDAAGASPRGSPPNGPDVESAAPALVWQARLPAGHSFRGALPCATQSASARNREESGTTSFRHINANLQPGDGPTGQDGVGGFCHVNLDAVLAQQASPLHLLAHAAGQERDERRSTGAVPTLGPAEPISGSPGSAENAASPSQPDLLIGGEVGSMEQPSASSHGLVTFSGGSWVPIGCLEGPGPTNNSAHDGLTLSDRPAKRKKADREADELCHSNPGGTSAAEHAARQDEGQDELLDLFFEQMMEFPAE